MTPVCLGIDFDNTLVCYDDVFHAVAVQDGLLPDGPRLSKQGVRDRLRQMGREDDWTALQGRVYGPCLAQAQPFPDALATLHQLRGRGIRLVLVSHKTLHPYRGPAYDLHQAARAWLEQHAAPFDEVFFELTVEAKLGRIGASGCGAFLDDLPEILQHRDFPPDTRRILFDPHGSQRTSAEAAIGAWSELAALL